MILTQWYTAMRPGEVVALRPADIDRTGKVWEYSPERHKTEHHGIERFVAIGPGGQEALRPYLLRVLAPDPEKPLFSPRDAIAERRARARDGRRPPLWPNPACVYIDEMGWADTRRVCGGSHYEVSYLQASPTTRRIVRQS